MMAQPTAARIFSSWQGWLVLVVLLFLLGFFYRFPVDQSPPFPQNPEEVCPKDCESLLGCEEETRSVQKLSQDYFNCTQQMTRRGYCEGMPPEVAKEVCPPDSGKGVTPDCIAIKDTKKEAEKMLSRCRKLAKKGFVISEYETCLSNRAQCRASIYSDSQKFYDAQQRKIVLRKIALWLWTGLSLALSVWGFFRTNQKIPSVLLGVVALLSLCLLGLEVLLHILFPHGFIAH